MTTFLPTGPGRGVGPPTTYLPREVVTSRWVANYLPTQRGVVPSIQVGGRSSDTGSTSPGRRPVGRDGPSTRSSRLMSVIPDCSARRLLDHYLPTSAPPAAATADNYLPTYDTLPSRAT